MIESAVLHESAARGDLIYPYAEFLPIKENATQAKITPTTFIFHSMAGPNLTSLDALWRYVNRDDVEIEPTFILDMTGRCAQLVEANVRADCNYKANPFALSVETQDNGSATLETTPWTLPQVEQLAGMAAWAHLRFGVALKLPTCWNCGGVNGHRAFPEWSKYTGKTCPGTARFNQIPLIIARAQQHVDWKPSISVTPTFKEPIVDMSLVAAGGRLYDSRNSGKRVQPGAETKVSVGDPDAKAAFITVTVTDSASPGYAQAAGQVGTSLLNWATGQTIANTTLVPVINGSVGVTVWDGSAHLIIDLIAVVK